MNTALVLAIFIAGIITGMGMFVFASLAGERLRERASSFPVIEDTEDGGRIIDFTRRRA